MAGWLACRAWRGPWHGHRRFALPLRRQYFHHAYRGRVRLVAGGSWHWRHGVVRDRRHCTSDHWAVCGPDRLSPRCHCVRAGACFGVRADGAATGGVCGVSAADGGRRRLWRRHLGDGVHAAGDRDVCAPARLGAWVCDGVHFDRSDDCAAAAWVCDWRIWLARRLLHIGGADGADWAAAGAGLHRARQGSGGAGFR